MQEILIKLNQKRCPLCFKLFSSVKIDDLAVIGASFSSRRPRSYFVNLNRSQVIQSKDGIVVRSSVFLNKAKTVKLEKCAILGCENCGYQRTIKLT